MSKESIAARLDPARVRQLEQQLLQSVMIQVDFSDKLVLLLSNAIHTLVEQAQGGNLVARQHLKLLSDNLKDASAASAGVILPSGPPPPDGAPH